MPITSDCFSQDVLAIVAGASTITERLSGALVPDDAHTNHEVVQARLAAWCQSSAGGNRELFRERLARDGFDLRMVQAVLGSMHVDKQHILPSWAHLLREVLLFTDKAPEDEATYNQHMTQLVHALATKQPVPFGEILAPFVAIAHQQLMSQSSGAFHLLAEQAHATLRDQLLQELVACAVDTLYAEFARERARTQEAEDACYQRFIEQMRSARLAAFFRQYSALARLLATLTEQWVAATAAFFQHLATDWPDIQNMLGANQPDQVAGIQPALSKSYHGGRRVMALTFASGGKVVYKPGNIGLEDAYYQLLAWCNQQAVAHLFKILACLNRRDHGWVEYIEHRPCRNQPEIHMYCQRAGMLLCLIYLLGGRNCLASHIIAYGEHPVLVDPSILMQPYSSPHHPDNTSSTPPDQSDEHLMYTVLHTGLLATWQLSRDKESIRDTSGLGTPGMASLLAQQKSVRTSEAASEVLKGMNIPLLNGCPQRLEDYVEDVVQGFQILYHFLLSHREDLLAETSPLYLLEQQYIRFFFRPDWMYSAMKEKLCTPAFSRDGVVQSIAMELLGSSIIQQRSEAEKKRWWPLYKAEQQALITHDTPRFTMRANSVDLILESGQKIERCFQTAGFTLVIDRLRRLSDEHLSRQSKLIQATLCVPVRAGRASRLIEDCAYVPTNEELITQALAIAEQIATRMVSLADGRITWLTPQYLPSAEQYQLQPMEYHLYSGTFGVALFLAALENITGGAGYRQMILTAVQPVVQALRRDPVHMVGATGIGAGTGLGSIIYALTRISLFLDEPGLLDDARQAARAMTATDIESDHELDVLAGAAGAILGLMALYDASPEQSILDQALLCGQYLLRASTISERGYRAWPNFNGKCLTGFSHGAAGIAYALLRLYSVTQNPSFLQAAKEGIAYEDSLFSTAEENWPDLRTDPPSLDVYTWCHGAPGIGLARAGGLSVLDTPQIRKDIDCALQKTQQCNLLDWDHLCCGNIGHVDILLTLSTLLSRPDLAAIARSLTGQVLTRAQQNGAFMFSMQFPPQVYKVELFQGMAGIGYELLRIAHPDRVPSLLLWH
ncbi:type 2 lanthipeptide synthetase LanM family protein [Dictyobacter aurantiacus]|uniref:Lanthionine synthetase n=1 Tax=Dictyobacter aurantiacus TaxID=1936993 RepID=A0A401ZKY8_9CHLR|nr:type 2 lanthipeptide synthetase LanM family protein [Dictyobacter aurantiacus]GCE07529.1 lanthionine synthetase [Dictyobacter aurantiacus]